MNRVLMWIGHEPLRKTLREALQRAGHRVEVASSKGDALRRVTRAAQGAAEPPRVVVVDADGDGGVLARCKEHLPETPVVVLSSTLVMDGSGGAPADASSRVGAVLDVVESALARREGAAAAAP